MLAKGSLVQDALSKAREHSGFGMLVDEAVTFGIFGVKCDLCALLSDGDRVELYRALVVEPKVARRRRAAHRQKVRQTKNRVPIADRTV
jgi:putative ubiquitin-RnfH superfamily antitoxin RatB of RatAB toxin-antitoxin module